MEVKKSAGKVSNAVQYCIETSNSFELEWMYADDEEKKRLRLEAQRIFHKSKNENKQERKVLLRICAQFNGVVVDLI